MSLNLFNEVKQAITNLNPHEIREQADRALRVGLFARSETAFQQMEAFFTPATLSSARLAQIGAVLQRASYGSQVVPPWDVEIYSYEMPVPKHGFGFDLNNPEHTVNDILKARPDLAIPLARHICPFREPVANQAIKKISKENALFSLATAIPDMIPFLSLPWAVGEFASDTAFLTANQIRLAFTLAAISDREVGYREQKGEMASILLGAFGWRAIARELIGKIPFGGGLLPKAAVAYAGTRVAGMSLERYYRVGYGFTRAERHAAYDDALTRGRTIAGSMLEGLKKFELSKKAAPGTQAG